MAKCIVNLVQKRHFSQCRVLKASIELSAFDVDRIRNFSIVAHVDHGKSTLADRILELAGSVEKSKANKQILDTLSVERERGITVKAQTASFVYKVDFYLCTLFIWDFK